MAVPRVLLRDGRFGYLGRIRPVFSVPFGRLQLTLYQNGRLTLVPRLEAYTRIPQPVFGLPEATNWREKAAQVIAQTYGNTQVGNCVIAGKLHQVGVWTAAESGQPALSSDAEAIRTYHEVCGPGDNGCIITDVLDWQKSRGLPCGGTPHRIDDYVRIDWTNKELVKAAIAIFGPSISYGINLPQQWGCTNCTWDENASGFLGGHDVPSIDYDAKGVQIATWGGLVTMTWAAALSRNWIEEAYCSLSPDWYARAGKNPIGLDRDELARDLDMLATGQVPPYPGPVPPGPGPSPGLLCSILTALLQGVCPVENTGLLCNILRGALGLLCPSARGGCACV